MYFFSVYIYLSHNLTVQRPIKFIFNICRLVITVILLKSDLKNLKEINFKFNFPLTLRLAGWRVILSSCSFTVQISCQTLHLQPPAPTCQTEANHLMYRDTWRLEFDSSIVPKCPEKGRNEYIRNTSAWSECWTTADHHVNDLYTDCMYSLIYFRLTS